MNKRQIEHCLYEWIPALCSNEYTQTQKRLTRNLFDSGKEESGYCCLGVACVIQPDIDTRFPRWKMSMMIDSENIAEYYGIINGSEISFRRFDDLTTSLPISAIRQPDAYPFWRVSLTDLNDSLHYSFVEIANVIEDACFSWLGMEEE